MPSPAAPFDHLSPANRRAAARAPAESPDMVASADFILACGARAGVAMRDIAPRSEATGTASDRILAAAKEMGLSA